MTALEALPSSTSRRCRATHRHSPFSSIEHGRISLKHLGCTYPSKTTREHSIYFHEQSAVVLAWAAQATTYMNTKVSAPKTRGLPWQQGTAPGSHTTCAQSQRLVPHGHEGSEQLGLGGQRESESLVARQRTRRQTHAGRAEARVYANAHPIGSLVSIASHKRACLVAAAALRVSTWGLAAW